MNKAVPLWLVVVLLVIALLPTVYLIGVESGKRRSDIESRPMKMPPKTAQRMPAQHPPATTPAPAPSAAPRTPPHAAGKFTHFRVGNRNVKSILADGDMVWVGTSGGVIRYDVNADDYDLFDVNNKALLSNGVFHLSKVGRQILVGTYGGGLSVFNKDSKQWRNYNIPDGLADQFVYDAELLPNGDLWIATWSGANLVPGAQLDAQQQWQTFDLENTNGGLPNDWVYGVESDSRGALWFATEAGVARYQDGQWTNWQHEDGVGAPYEKVKADIQFSSDPASASKHHARQKTDQGFGRVKGAYNPNYVVSLEVTADDRVWAGTWGGGAAVFDGSRWRNYTVKEGLPSNHVFTLYEDEQGQLWIGTSHGLAKFEQKSGRFVVYTKQHGLFADNVFSMAMDDNGHLWAGSFGGVARLSSLP